VEPSEPQRPGRSPTTRIENLERSASELAPHESLQRLEATARVVLGTVGAISAIITGFGAFGGSVATDHLGWAIPSLVLFAAGVSLALLAAVGKADDGNFDDLEDVDRFYAEQIEWRGRLIRIASACVALALVLAVLPAVRQSTETSPEAKGRTPLVVFNQALVAISPCQSVLSGERSDEGCGTRAASRRAHDGGPRGTRNRSR
jgi:hypothetical protein